MSDPTPSEHIKTAREELRQANDKRPELEDESEGIIESIFIDLDNVLGNLMVNVEVTEEEDGGE